ncbi:tRNA glutamyl-Q(34) synthetase GluQRS [Rhodobacteraceae bacterium NNCM2]|nr:tRNA glutamyl-Q(34) synthetase GluQRS [Coraliihabitans acroporae]
MNSTTHTERFAPSPTGRLHLGHAYSAILAHDRARAAGGRFLVRMEDLDTGRVRAEFYDGIVDDLGWLGLSWEKPVVCQSARLALYDQALTDLTKRGLTYPCTCTRRDIAEAAAAPQEGAPMTGPDGLVYPGTCRGRVFLDDAPAAVRLNIAAAIEELGGASAVRGLTWLETGSNAGTHAIDPDALLHGTGDIVLRRKDGAPAYHLAVVVDDAAQAVTHVTRGEDLAQAVPVQRLLQALLQLPVPTYHHHRLIRDESGRRLAKRHDSLALATMRANGATPGEVRRMLGLPP